MGANNLTATADIIAVREVDFVTRFSNNWQDIRDVMGIMRLIPKTAGTVLKSKYAEVVLESGAVGEGQAIPYSQARVKERSYAPITLNKYKKAVSAEAISDHGYDAAVQMTDDQFLYELQGVVCDGFYAYLQTGTLFKTAPTFQAALAKAQGEVRNKWKKMKKGISEIVGFCNILDAYQYLGAADISVQTLFGMNYIENFLGYRRLFLTSEIPTGKVIATPVENLVLYYINPADSDFARAGLEFRVDGETPLIGFHVDGNYNTLVSESTALMGMVLFAEYIDGIAVVNINSTDMTGATVGDSTASTYWGVAKSSFQTSLSVTGEKVTGTLKKLTGSNAITNVWGEGYFMAVKFTNFSSGVTFSDVQVGLVPSVSSGFQTLDDEQDAVIKVTDKENQKLVVVQKNGDKTFTQVFDLSGMTLTE